MLIIVFQLHLAITCQYTWSSNQCCVHVGAVVCSLRNRKLNTVWEKGGGNVSKPFKKQSVLSNISVVNCRSNKNGKYRVYCTVGSWQQFWKLVKNVINFRVSRSQTKVKLLDADKEYCQLRALIELSVTITWTFFSIITFVQCNQVFWGNGFTVCFMPHLWKLLTSFLHQV